MAKPSLNQLKTETKTGPIRGAQCAMKGLINLILIGAWCRLNPMKPSDAIYVKLKLCMSGVFASSSKYNSQLSISGCARSARRTWKVSRKNRTMHKLILHSSDLALIPTLWGGYLMRLKNKWGCATKLLMIELDRSASMGHIRLEVCSSWE